MSTLCLRPSFIFLFLSLFFSIAPTLIPSFFPEGTQNRWRRKWKGKDRKKWNGGLTDEWQERWRKKRGRDNWIKKGETGPFLAYINVWILKGASAVDVLHCTPPPLLLLLANHHTTLLYLGHSNVLLLSPLADALCCNLRKIGWEEEKSEESGRREGVVTEARSSLPSKNWTSSFVISFPNTVSIFLSSRHLSLHPYSPYSLRPAAAASSPPPSAPRFYSWVDSHCAQIINEIFSKLLHLKWIWKSLVFKGNVWAIDFLSAQKPRWYLMDGPWGERMRKRECERKNKKKAFGLRQRQTWWD